jgi:hypothetical protein
VSRKQEIQPEEAVEARRMQVVEAALVVAAGAVVAAE